MVKADKETAVIFLHIPKTAGTTLVDILQRHYPPHRRYHLGAKAQDAVAEFKALSEEQRRSIQLLYGHMGYGLHTHFPQGAAYFTILREPVERVISFYYFVRSNNEHYLHDFSLKDTPDLAGFVRSGETVMTDNFQVRFISGIWDDVLFGGVTEEHLALAKQILRDEILVVGLTERFDETLLLLKDAFGWPNVWYRSRNITQNRPQREAVSPQVLQAIAEQNHFDMELYAYAQALFAERIAAKGMNFKLRVWWLHYANSLRYTMRQRQYAGRQEGKLL